MVRLVWMNEETRDKTTLRVTEVSGMSTKVKPFKPVKLPSGKETTNTRPASFKDCPKAYVGKEVNESAEGFAPIYVSWAGSDSWGPNMDQLFFSPTALGIAESVNGMVRSIAISVYSNKNLLDLKRLHLKFQFKCSHE